ncbi:hypothetical protein B5S33_g1098 [[Candida] boidinii]|nr:hypothetical protein B5S33_g1098 [[Candida] boidinii]
MDDSEVGNKYDRQVRLWNSIGQSSLSNANICIIDINITTSEILKNLVLSGVGNIKIIDNRSINDLSNFEIENNFFLNPISKNDLIDNISVAKLLSKNLQQLNPDVSITYIDNKDISDLITFSSPPYLNTEFWSQFDCIISTKIFDKSTSLSLQNKLIPFCYNNYIPCISVLNIGFYAFLKIIYNERTIIDTHKPTSLLQDLRLDKPWLELQNYINSFEFNKLSDIELSNIPYSIILSKLSSDFKLKNKNNNNQSSLPPSPTTKQIRELIKNLYRSGDESNIDEAYKKANKLNKISNDIPDNLVKIFNEIENHLNNSEIYNNLPIFQLKFWLLSKTLKIFVDSNDYLVPLNGLIDDMESNTENYNNLKKLYTDKSLKDFKSFKEVLLIELNKFNTKTNKSIEINDSEIKNFIKNSRFIEFEKNSTDLSNSLNSALLDPLQNDYKDLININIYLGFLAIEKFYHEHNKYPTDSSDSAELRAIMISILCYYDINSFPEGLDKILDEFIRYKGLEIHNVSSLIGGITSQEIIKILTNQYLQLDNCLTFDGIRSKAETWKL